MVGGRVPWEGLVEVRVNDIFVRVCTKDWTVVNNDVLCRELGYSKALCNDILLIYYMYIGILVMPEQATYGTGCGDDCSWLEGVNCVGNESSILYCPREDILGTCNIANDLVVLCDRMLYKICSNNDIL